ncbi:MAG: ribose-5-phosphate isomerase RpiA [Sphingomonas sp.]
MKRRAAAAAVEAVRDDMVIGLGTGSTAAFVVELLARRVADGLAVSAVATSRGTEAAARALGIPILPLAGLSQIDLCIDGVDEIDPELRAIKGGGGAMLIEKIVASMAKRNIAVADASKRVPRLGARPVPLEVLPAAQAFVAARVADLGASAVLRGGTGAAFVTDAGNAILDCRFGPIADPAALATALSAIPGVFGHGLFVTEIDGLYIADAAGNVALETRPDSRNCKPPARTATQEFSTHDR